MRTQFRSRINAIFAFVILFLVALGCDAWVTLKGKVLDENGKPISDAKILVEQGSRKVIEVTSQKDGSYDLHKSVTPFPFSFSSVKVTVSKEGYQTFEKEFNSRQSQEELERGEINITLKKN
jgi:hypothetical protein